jgi:hypothetical protein
LRNFLFASLAISITACQPEPPPFDESLALVEVMVHVIEPAAEVYWDSVGIVLDAEGTHEIAPSNSSEWLAVENAAATLIEAGNILLTPARQPGDPRWIEMARALSAAGVEALAAADARDTDAVFEAGGNVYLACANCHAAFAPALLPANFLPEE